MNLAYGYYRSSLNTIAYEPGLGFVAMRLNPNLYEIAWVAFGCF